MFELDGPNEWFEVWWDDSSRPPYLLILFGGASPDRFEIYDPKEGRVINTVKTYGDAQNWLWEDEYRLIQGRTTAND